MKERPILFGGPMVRAIKDDHKTKTRRVVKPQPDILASDGTARRYKPLEVVLNGELVVMHGPPDDPRDARYVDKPIACPYGGVRDRLWVRETWRADYEHGENTRGAVPPWVEYRADTQSDGPADGSADAESPKWKPSIFMPRWASRITLEIVDVKVEQVQDISEADAIAEGALPTSAGDGYPFAMSARMNFVDLWDSINLKRGYGWAVNPWVWCISFRRIV